jgi:hypothetical protein
MIGPKISRQNAHMAGDSQKMISDLQRKLAAYEAELAEARAQQTATAEVLGVINASPGDLAPVSDAILEKSTALCEATFGSLLMYDGEHFENVAVRNVPEAFAEFARPGRVIAFGPGTGPYRLLTGETFVHIIDGQAEEAYRRYRPAGADRAGGRPNLGDGAA